jgi:hypothetical protein
MKISLKKLVNIKFDYLKNSLLGMSIFFFSNCRNSFKLLEFADSIGLGDSYIFNDKPSL